MLPVLSTVPFDVVITGGGIIPSPTCRCFNGRASMACTTVVGNDDDEGVSSDKSSDKGVSVAVEAADVGNGSNKLVSGAIPSGGSFFVRICMNMYPSNKTAKQNTAPETRPWMNELPVDRSLVVVV